MGFNRGGGYGGGGFRGGNGGGQGGGQSFQPQPGSGTLFIKGEKRTATGPDYDGYFIADRVIQPGEKIKLVGWDKAGRTGPMINLKVGREPQNAPGFDQGGQAQQGGYGGAPQQGYGRNPAGYQNNAPQQPRYQAPAQHAQGAYQGGGYGGQPAQTYQAPQNQPAAPQPTAGTGQAPAQNFAFPPPAANEDLPF